MLNKKLFCFFEKILKYLKIIYKCSKANKSFFNKRIQNKITYILDKNMQIPIWYWPFKIMQSHDNYSFFTLLDGTKSPMYRVIPFKRTPVTLYSKTSVPLSHSKATIEHVEGEFKFGISTTTEYWFPKEKILLINCSFFKKNKLGNIRTSKRHTLYRISC